jgi:hypothetical protein
MSIDLLTHDNFVIPAPDADLKEAGYDGRDLFFILIFFIYWGLIPFFCLFLVIKFI